MSTSAIDIDGCVSGLISLLHGFVRGRRMPAEMEFIDIRKGSDLEFGQSIYEPFGIAQLEPLSFGALCCVSNVCGCLGFVDRAMAGLQHLSNVVVADYVSLPYGQWLGNPYDAL
ncbi:MAG TPA: hypothetical protein PKE45_26270, partial [Caldilineaceae bacterium]|nr:hypothetical protein [Caldilineaceae bacterium]